MSVFNVLVYGTMTSICVCLIEGLTLDTKWILVYLSMVLGALMAIATTLEKRQ